MGAWMMQDCDWGNTWGHGSVCGVLGSRAGRAFGKLFDWLMHFDRDACVTQICRCPAARLCVGLPRMPSGSGFAPAVGGQGAREPRVALECCAWPHEQDTLHVQSVSRWAPSNIGPYSQAKSLCNMVFVSGQIALEPASMQLVADTASAQATQCLRNLEVLFLLASVACASLRGALFGLCLGNLEVPLFGLPTQSCGASYPCSRRRRLLQALAPAKCGEPGSVVAAGLRRAYAMCAVCALARVAGNPERVRLSTIARSPSDHFRHFNGRCGSSAANLA